MNIFLIFAIYTDLYTVFAKSKNRKRSHRKRSLIIEREFEDVVTCIAHTAKITSQQLCDGHQDCPDNSDEFSCIEMNWSDRQVPTQCKSEKNCTDAFQYQYNAQSGKCEQCSETMCGSCLTVARFGDLHSCLKRCQVPDSIRVFQSLKFNLLYGQLYPHQLKTPWRTHGLVEGWRTGQVRPIQKQKSKKRKLKNFALRGVLLLIDHNKYEKNGFDVTMTRAEEMGQHWLNDVGFTTRLTVSLRRNRHISPGREYILTGHTNGRLDPGGKLHITDAIFRKSKSRALRREVRHHYSSQPFG